MNKTPSTSKHEVLGHQWTLEDNAEAQLLEREDRLRTLARLRLLWRERRFLVRVSFIGLLAATVLAFLIPKRYTSEVRLMPPDQQSGMGTAMLAALAGRAGAGSAGASGGGLAALAGDVLGVKTSGDLFVGVLQSRTVEENLVRKFDLRKVYGQRYWEDACKDLEKHSDITQDRKSGIITIAVTDRSPERAAAIASEYGSELNRAVNQFNTSSAHRERVFLEGRLQEVKQDLEAAEKEFSQFSSKNTAIDIKEQGKAMVEAAAVLQGQLIAAQSQLEGLRQIYTENSSRVKATEAQVEGLRSELSKLGGSDSAAPHDDSNSVYPSIRKLPLLGVTYADLYRRTKIDEVVFESLTQEYELAKVQEAKDTPSVKVLDNARVPEKKSFPPRLLIMAAGALFSFFLSVAWLWATAAWTEIDASDPRKVFGRELMAGLKGHFRKSRVWPGKSKGTPSWDLHTRPDDRELQHREPELNVAANDK